VIPEVGRILYGMPELLFSRLHVYLKKTEQTCLARLWKGLEGLALACSKRM
jgi:hypothetical protein